MQKLIIIVRGGTVISVYAQEKQAVEIIDMDDLTDEEGRDDNETREIMREATAGLKEIY